ncbi:glycoside hydrolase family 16 protein [Pseudonocardia sp. WMMC193]|uniref:glycoside hydrolase family 16 protein n=1 Tax=Pseudonocardia sp. WMMC193 TaxID=2911965 RepID=UPI001F15A0FD|nr:glycoside hydrolase family 16 protein [Pseudonocardia sp. WMMC193]MCF7551776.1 glycoside hydrolase family 16 protein [Pseudonocardia sp. WMMC193]
MRRKPSAAEDRLDPRELVERYTAEHSLPTVRTGRRRRAEDRAESTSTLPSSLATLQPDHDSPREPALLTHSTLLSDPDPLAEFGSDTSPHGLPELDPDGDGPPPLSPMTGMPVIAVADLVAGHSAAADAPGAPDTDTPDTVIEREAPEPPRRGRRRAPRSTLRRLAPLTVGAAAVLVATMVVVLLQPVSDDGPDLSASLVSSDTAQGAPETSSTGVAPIPAPGGLAEVVGSAKDRATTTTNPPAAVVAPQPGRNAGRAAVAVPAGDGSTAAGRMGWRQVGGDEFDGGLGKWGVYDGAGHGGNGRRTPDAVSTNGGVLTIRGDANGNSGGMMYNDSQRFGRYEMRAKFPKGTSAYHPVLILWPTDVEWPRGGEVDFAETNSAADDVSFFLHYGAANNQVSETRNLDITQWHNYAVEWTNNGIVGYIDGVEWFRSTDGNTLPPGKMAPTIQLDYFPGDGPAGNAEMQVDWMRIYAT